MTVIDMYDFICLVNTSFVYSFSYRDSMYGKVVEKSKTPILERWVHDFISSFLCLYCN